MKRTLDFIVALIACLMLSPLLFPIIILLKLTGEGKIFYVQQRIGLRGKKFGLLKFATMLENSPNIGSGDITTKNDPRVLPVGRLLRKSKLNELPQLFNILLGDMSLVGPRPLTPRNFDFYGQDVQKIINNLRPGLTGVGSLVFRDEERYLHEACHNPMDFYQNEITPFKGSLEVWYADNQSFFLDIQIIYLTAWSVLYPNTKAVRKLLKNLPTHPVFLK
jgi:lipopolysaccharide/colanic/teichoic acid biosynthesis glycosyltransferase